MSDAALCERICAVGASLFRRGLTFGSTGNISVRHPDGGWLMTPTNASLGELDPARLSRLDEDGALTRGDQPTKEAFLHRVMYMRRANAQAVVHLHSTHSVAVSCLQGLDHCNCLPPLTAYYVMRVGRLPVVPYCPPGDESLALAVDKLAGEHHAVLLANHGPVVAGTHPRQCHVRHRGTRGDGAAVPAPAQPAHQPVDARPGRGSARTPTAVVRAAPAAPSRLNPPRS